MWFCGRVWDGVVNGVLVCYEGILKCILGVRESSYGSVFGLGVLVWVDLLDWDGVLG